MQVLRSPTCSLQKQVPQPKIWHRSLFLELSETCFAAGPKNSSPGLVLWEGVERGVFVFPGFSGCWMCVVELILSLCPQFSPSSVSLVKCPAQWAEMREEVTSWQMGWACCLYPPSSKCGSCLIAVLRFPEAREAFELKKNLILHR